MCRWVLAQHPRLTSARIAFGRALLEAHKLADAALALDRAARELPGSFAAHQWLAETLAELGDVAGATAALAQATLLSPENPRVAWLSARLTPGGLPGRPTAAPHPDPALAPQRITSEYPPAAYLGAEPQPRDHYGPDDFTPVTEPLPLTEAAPRRRAP